MRTTVVIDDQLLKEAMRAIGARSKREAIVAGLQTLVRQRNRDALRNELGTYEIDLSLKELNKLRTDG